MSEDPLKTPKLARGCGGCGCLFAFLALAGGLVLVGFGTQRATREAMPFGVIITGLSVPIALVSGRGADLGVDDNQQGGQRVMSSLTGRTAVVTGGSRGIGEAVSRRLAEQGAAVVVTARSAADIERVAAEITAAGGTAYAKTCDVSDEAAIAELADFSKAKLGQVDILVNNAGIASSSSIKRLQLDDWNRIMTVNATGPFLCTRAFIAGMCERKFGRIVTIASVASRMGGPYIAAYTASKHAVLGFTRSVASEVAKSGVTANCVCPGYVDTAMTDQAVSAVMKQTGRPAEEALAAILKTVGQSRLITPAEVAHMTVALCAEDAGGVTGQAIGMDAGGFCA